MFDWRKKLNDLKNFVYNKETHEVLGRTVLSWAKLGGFFLVFYTLIGGFFAIHLAVFVGITPSPGPGIAPWNFGKYAYPNYPNAKLGMIAIPPYIQANGTYATYIHEHISSLDTLLEAASTSGARCMNYTNNYGYSGNRSCVLLRVAKVFEWTPNAIQPFLPSPVQLGDYLNLTCNVEQQYSHLGIQVSWDPPGLPLNIPNTLTGQSYPFENQGNYIVPLVGVILDFSNVSLANSFDDFQVEVLCEVDKQALGITAWSDQKIAQTYELPENVKFFVNFKNIRL